jgi:hypothetical protein
LKFQALWATIDEEEYLNNYANSIFDPNCGMCFSVWFSSRTGEICAGELYEAGSSPVHSYSGECCYHFFKREGGVIEDP